MSFGCSSAASAGPSGLMASTASSASETRRRRGSGRWWLREVVHDNSLSSGFYEVQSGIVCVHPAPMADSPDVAPLRAGTRFAATPHWVGGAVWLEVARESMPPPLFAGVREAASGKDTLSYLFEISGHGTSPLVTSEEAGASESFWIEDDKRYISRVRDFDLDLLRNRRLRCEEPRPPIPGCPTFQSVQKKVPPGPRPAAHYRVSVGVR